MGAGRGLGLMPNTTCFYSRPANNVKQKADWPQQYCSFCNFVYDMMCCLMVDPKPPPIAKFAAEFLFPPKKNTCIRIIKIIQHSNKWLACYLKWIILVISKLLVITDGCRFCNIKETDNNKYTIHVDSHFSLGSTAQPKLFVISRILADFF